MLKPKLILAMCALLSLSSNTYADSTDIDSMTNYHFQAGISESTATLRRVELTWPIMSNLLQEDLQDLQVYNADQQPVPFMVRSVSTTKQVMQQTRQLNFFPMGDLEKLGTILKQEDDEQRYKAIKLIQTGERYLIIDSPNPNAMKNPLPLQQLTLQWDSLDHWLPKSLIIEASDDLTNWQALAVEKLPYRMAENGVVIENHSLNFKQATQKRFIRLSGNEDFEPLLKALKGVSGDYRRTSFSRPLNWDKADLTLGKDSKQYYYNLPPSLPVKRWYLEGSQPNTVYKGRLYTRSTEQRGQKRIGGISINIFYNSQQA